MTHADPLTRFPARERRGVFLGLDKVQATLAGGSFVATALLWALPVPASVALAGTVVAVLVMVIAMVSFRGVSVLLMATRLVRFAHRKRRQQNTFQRDTWDEPTTAGTPRPPGTTKDGQHIPQIVASHVLPGELGDVAVVQIPFKGAFVHNAKTGMVSVTVTVKSTAWELRDGSNRDAAYRGLVDWFSGLQTIEGLQEATLRVRVDKAATTDLADYADTRDAELAESRVPGTVDDAVRQEYAKLIAQGARQAMAFTNTITLTFHLPTMSRAVRHAGGGLVGISNILTDRVDQLRSACEHSQLELDKWLWAVDFDDLMAMSLDPVTAATHRETVATRVRAVTRTAPLMAVEESLDHVRIDGSVHQTLWMAEWPRVETDPGFLGPLLYAGDCTRTLTLQLRPVPMEKSLTIVNRDQASLDFADEVRLKLRQNTTKRQEREREDLNSREEDLVNGYGDLKLRGFITISAPDVDALTRSRSEILQARQRAHVVLASMWGQQAAAFATAVLPVPTTVS